MPPPFWNSKVKRLKEYGIEVTLNGITFILNAIKIHQLLEKLLAGDTLTDNMVIL
jgi:hypothetical protein